MSPQDKNRLDIGRLRRMTEGFSSFTVAGMQEQRPMATASGRAPGYGTTVSGPGSASAATATRPILDDTAKDALRVVFSRDGSYVQVGD